MQYLPTKDLQPFPLPISRAWKESKLFFCVLKEQLEIDPMFFCSSRPFVDLDKCGCDVPDPDNVCDVQKTMETLNTDSFSQGDIVTIKGLYKQEFDRRREISNWMTVIQPGKAMKAPYQRRQQFLKLFGAPEESEDFRLPG